MKSLPCKLLKSIGSFWFWTCCINVNWHCLSSVAYAFLFRQGLGKWRHVWKRGFRFSHLSNLPLRSKSCHFCINHYQSLVLFISFTSNTEEKVFQQWSQCWSWLVSTSIFWDRTLISLWKTSKPQPVLPKAQRKPLCSTSPLSGKLPLLQLQGQLRKCFHVAHCNPACCIHRYKNLLYTEELMKFDQKCPGSYM